MKESLCRNGPYHKYEVGTSYRGYPIFVVCANCHLEWPVRPEPYGRDVDPTN